MDQFYTWLKRVLSTVANGPGAEHYTLVRAVVELGEGHRHRLRVQFRYVEAQPYPVTSRTWREDTAVRIRPVVRVIDNTFELPVSVATDRHRSLGMHGVPQLAERAWSEIIEDRMMAAEVDRRRSEITQMLASGLTREQLRAQLEQLYVVSDHAERHHPTATEVRMREAEARALGSRRYVDLLNDNMRDALMYGLGIGAGLPEVEARGYALLKSCLSPTQKETFEVHGYIEVRGGASGKMYRIKKGRQMNIFELDGKGREVQGFCVLPAGNLCTGDVMLGQKIALEVEEAAALKIANKFPATHARRSQRPVDPSTLEFFRSRYGRLA